ncbi:MAG: hypothetical protein HUK06_03575 [Bacteroidaceae bacterium]|nr:hypothetical protein [Bacteroidaceae bacterium]
MNTHLMTHSILKRTHGLLIVLAMCCLLSCNSDSQYNNSQRCYLVIDNSIHLDPTLMSCMNSMSPGVFCRISLGLKNGAQTYFIESNHNTKSSFTLNEVDIKRSKILGVYNETGLIVGFGNLDNPPVFYAYDAICPNCYEQSQVGSYQPLKMDSNGQATCNICKRSYNLNTGGNIITGDAGRQLYRYRASTTGPQGTLSVSN